ncbi:hypothetical protein [Acetivibrio straminisolvens]|uniref:hypothetical protein n=1 Tax=Acetivibrio straminisolvens TaxID=253314 RepID=UPI00223F5237|nr:hypothetical protein [Acetivibrio straminisolvens]
MKKVFKQIILCIFPLFIVGMHYFTENNFFEENRPLYIVGFGLLIYTFFNYYYSENSKREHFIRKVYFIYTYFFIIFIYPKVLYNNDSYNLWANNGGILNFNTTASVCIIIAIISFLIYLFIISDFHISEVSLGNAFGNAKVSMLKEKYTEEINNQFENTNQLIEKIKIEGKLLEGMREYCEKVVYKFEQDKIFSIFSEYQILLTEYFKEQEENIKVTVLRELNEAELKEEFHLKSGEINILKYKLENDEICSIESNNSYYLFIPFYYVFEEFFNDEKPVYIVLESQIPIICEVESIIINNLLLKFCVHISGTSGH